MSIHALTTERRNRGMTRAELARIINRDPMTVYRYERGLRTPSPEVIQRLIDWSEGRLTLADFLPRDAREDQSSAPRDAAASLPPSAR